MIEFNQNNSFYKVSESRNSTQWPLDPDSRQRLRNVIESEEVESRTVGMLIAGLSLIGLVAVVGFYLMVYGV